MINHVKIACADKNCSYVFAKLHAFDKVLTIFELPAFIEPCIPRVQFGIGSRKDSKFTQAEDDPVFEFVFEGHRVFVRRTL